MRERFGFFDASVNGTYIVLGHIFKDNEEILHDLNKRTLVVLLKSVDLFYEKNMSDN